MYIKLKEQLDKHTLDITITACVRIFVFFTRLPGSFSFVYRRNGDVAQWVRACGADATIPGSSPLGC